MQSATFHNFHIPVMGLAFTVDTPIKVARYGISSVISIIEDKLIEMMRKHYYAETGRPFTPIAAHAPDARARRITDYLNLVNAIVRDQVDALRNAAFEKGSEIVKYFELLPDNNPIKARYRKMLNEHSPAERKMLQNELRSAIRPGSIDVNIMTKVDKNNVDRQGHALPDSSDAVAALRGYVNSELSDSSVIFSAGLNPRLFNYLARVTAFDPHGYGQFDKKVVIKVSDYRSALIQGKYLARKGIWVSEFRIESGLNCGGHAFATDGTLLGPILEEFKSRATELKNALFSLYNPAMKEKKALVFDEPHPIKISVQGGIGTYEEATFLRDAYGVHSTGWGTPFLLCPEATTVDEETRTLLSAAKEDDVVLSNNSPLGVRFNYLKGTSAEKEKQRRIKEGRPGSPCTEKHLVSNTEFSDEPICTASHTYQKQKIAQLQSLNLEPGEYEKQYNDVVSKECLCIGLMNAAVHAYSLPPVKKLEAVTVCPGPNIAYFSKVVTLREMVDHIYGRSNIIVRPDRPHMFIKELELNVSYLKERLGSNEKMLGEVHAFGTQLLHGIAYYCNRAEEIVRNGKTEFVEELRRLENSIRDILCLQAAPRP